MVLKFWIVGQIYSIKHSLLSCAVYCKSNLKSFAYKFLTQVQELLKKEVQNFSDILEGHLTLAMSFVHARTSATVVFTKPHKIKMVNILTQTHQTTEDLLAVDRVLLGREKNISYKHVDPGNLNMIQWLTTNIGPLQMGFHVLQKYNKVT